MQCWSESQNFCPTLSKWKTQGGRSVLNNKNWPAIHNISWARARASLYTGPVTGPWYKIMAADLKNWKADLEKLENRNKIIFWSWAPGLEPAYIWGLLQDPDTKSCWLTWKVGNHLEKLENSLSFIMIGHWTELEVWLLNKFMILRTQLFPTLLQTYCKHACSVGQRAWIFAQLGQRKYSGWPKCA